MMSTPFLLRLMTVASILCCARASGSWSSKEEAEFRQLEVLDYLPDFDLPDFGDIMEAIGDTLCNVGVGLACEETITGDAPRCRSQTPLSPENFDLDRYVNQTWYVQMQQEWPLLSKKQMNCVLHTYTSREDGYFVAHHYANDKKVGGTVLNLEMYTALAGLCMKQESGGDLMIGNCGALELTLGLEDLNITIDPFKDTAGPYWVLAVGDDYEWAIVSGGQTDVERESKHFHDEQGVKQEVTYCTTPKGSSLVDIYQGAGLFLMSRDPVASSASMTKMMQTLEEKQIYDGDLKDVQQEGCDYNGATIKP